jgi:anti-sigma factor RsiW
MVTCRSVIDRLGPLAEGQGEPPGDAIATRHLARCISCARYLQTYRTTMVLARETSRGPEARGRPAMPESLVRRILWSRRGRSFSRASLRVLHLIGVAASPLIVFSLAR